MPYACPQVRKDKAKERYYKNRAARMQQRKAYYQANKEHHYGVMRRWCDDNPDRKKMYGLLASVKARAKANGLAYNLDVHWFKDRLASGHCAATGLPFVRNAAGKHKHAPSIDRVDASKGYTKDNCRVVVWHFNAARNEFSDADLEELARAFVAKRNL